jgi:hypothetical protein
VLRPLLEGFKKRSRAEIYLMLGNDVAAGCADDLEILELDGLAKYINMRAHDFEDFIFTVTVFDTENVVGKLKKLVRY